MASSPEGSLMPPRPCVAGVTDTPAPLGHDQDLAGAPAHGTAGPQRHFALALGALSTRACLLPEQLSSRARSHSRFAPPLIHLIPDSPGPRRDSEPPFPRACFLPEQLFSRVRSHSHFAPPLIYLIPDSPGPRRDSEPPFPRACFLPEQLFSRVRSHSRFAPPLIHLIHGSPGPRRDSEPAFPRACLFSEQLSGRVRSHCRSKPPLIRFTCIPGSRRDLVTQ